MTSTQAILYVLIREVADVAQRMTPEEADEVIIGFTKGQAIHLVVCRPSQGKAEVSCYLDDD